MSQVTYRAGVLTVSDKGSVGARQDTSGAALQELLAALHLEVARYEIVSGSVGWNGTSGTSDYILTSAGVNVSVSTVAVEKSA